MMKKKIFFQIKLKMAKTAFLSLKFNKSMTIHVTVDNEHQNL